MNIKRFFASASLLALSVMTAATLSAQTPHPELENPAVNSINRLPARAYSMPLADVRAALTDDLEPKTPYTQSLNGYWKISWSGDPALGEKDFWKTDYDDSLWETITVPCCVELRGFGFPGYTNVRYPHAKMQPLIRDVVSLEDDYNPVSSYRTHFTVPESWKGRDIVLRFDGVYSAYYVWVNGQKVGYAEDSKLPSEFDITPYLQKGENLLAVEVYRWCDGSYLEDQDMFRFSGIYRDVTLIGMPHKRIEDFFVRTEIAENQKSAKLNVTVTSTAGSVSSTLYDADYKKVGSLNGKNGSITVNNPRLWSAEDPYLYTLVMKSGSDIRATRVGLKQVEIKDAIFMVNGSPVKLKGVNRHEHSAVNGRTVSMDDMMADILLMKNHNINTVRTSHYPDHHSWYDLCDRYGIYLVAEANVEGHEYGYGDDGLGLKPEWNKPIVERNANHVMNYRNHPSIVFWSLGNETGHGPAFINARDTIKTLDPTRPVHWERGNEDADMVSTMYPVVDWVYQRGKDWSKPSFLCEYAHAMGNAVGNLKEYWDAIYATDNFIGGCIWDWVDQALYKSAYHFDDNGQRQWFLAYGGDWGEMPNDGPFCCNGLIQPDRKPTPKLLEVAHVYRQIDVTSKDGRTAEIWNHFSFTNTDRFAASWILLEDGVKVADGEWNVPSVAPLQKVNVPLPETGYSFKDGCEYFINVSFAVKEPSLWCEAGHVIASDQVAVKAADAVSAQSCAVRPSVDEDEYTVTVTCGDFKAVFSKYAKMLMTLTSGGKPVMAEKAGMSAAPHISYKRAFVDNDVWLRDGWGKSKSEYRRSFTSYGMDVSRTHTYVMNVTPLEDGSVDVKFTGKLTTVKSAGFKVETVWHFSTDGTVTLTTDSDPFGTMPEALPRFGLRMLLDRRLENVEWYGRGPQENYVDRCSGSFIGRYQSTVTDMYVNYVRPQDNGYRSDVRWVEFTDDDGNGVRFSGSEPLFVQALHYSHTDLDYARHRNGEAARVCFPSPSKDIYLNLDIRQLGLGGASCGPKPMDKYIFPIQREKWSITISPVKK